LNVFKYKEVSMQTWKCHCGANNRLGYSDCYNCGTGKPFFKFKNPDLLFLLVFFGLPILFYILI